MKYLLPCSACQNKIAVGSGQAGQSVRCNCGQKLDVPSIRAMRELEPAGEGVVEAKSTWSRRKGLVFLGSIIMAVAAGYVGFVEWSKPKPAEIAEVRREVEKLSPADSYRLLQSALAASGNPMIRRYRSKEEIPFNLLPSAEIIVQFEGVDAMGNYWPLAPKALGDIGPKMFTYATRRAWLPVAAVVGIIGLLVAGSALLVPPAPGRTAKTATPRPSRPKAMK